jgi:predicted transcriptional regulator
MEFVDYQRWYTPSDVFELDKALQYIAEKEIQVVKDGFDGLRVARNESWIDRSHWDNFDAHEETMEAVIGAHKIIAICIFPIHKCAAGQFVDIVSNHRGGVILSCGKLEVIGPSKGKHGEKRDIFREPMTRRAPRSCFDIYANVIEAASSGALASRLISKGNLNTQRFARIVKTMIDNGLLRTWATSPRIFAATEKGREFLIKYRNLKKMVRIG